MGVKLIILLALLLGVLYCLHLLVKDYQAVTAPRLLRMLFKRDLHPPHQHPAKPYVRWKKILRHDAAQCARLLYCSLGAHAQRSQLEAGFVRMLRLEPREEDTSSLAAFQVAFDVGAQGRLAQLDDVCAAHYPRCPFPAATLARLLDFLITNNIFAS